MDIIRRKSIVWSGTSREDIRAFAEAIYVFHAFQKKSRQTSKDDIRLARNRYRAMLKERKTR